MPSRNYKLPTEHRQVLNLPKDPLPTKKVYTLTSIFYALNCHPKPVEGQNRILEYLHKCTHALQMSKAHLVSVTKTSPYGCASTLVFYINFQILNVTLSLSKGKPHRHAELVSSSHPTIINCLLNTEHHQFLSLPKDHLPTTTVYMLQSTNPQLNTPHYKLSSQRRRNLSISTSTSTSTSIYVLFFCIAQKKQKPRLTKLPLNLSFDT